MKKVLAILPIVILVVLAMLALTKPEKMAHYDALKSIVMKAVEAKVGKSVPSGSLRTQATYMALGEADKYLKKNLVVYEETFYNKGILVYDGYLIPVSIGIMGHVFLTFDTQYVEELMEQVNLEKTGILRLNNLRSK